MKRLSLSTAQFKAVKDFLLDLNLCNKHTSDSKILTTALNLLLYGEENLREAQDNALKRLGLEPVQSFDQTKLIHRWAQQSEVAKSGGLIEPPDMEHAPLLEAELRKTEEELKSPSDVPPLYRDKPEEIKIPKAKMPPWVGIGLMPIEDIKASYPRHPLLKFANKGKTHKLAVEAAFGAMPLVLHKSTEIHQLTENIYKSFVEWKQENA